MSQDSMLGQSISGYRGLDVPLNALGALMAARSGQLGQLVALQGIRRAQEQEAQYQLPQLRAQALQSPEVREQLRLEGPGGQTAPAYGLRGPAIPSAAAMLTGGHTGPDAQAQLQQVALRGQAAGMPSDTPAAAMTNDAVDRAYKLASAQNLLAMTSGLGQGGTGAPEGMILRGASRDPKGGLRYEYGFPDLTTVPTGTQLQPGVTAKGGERVGNKQIAVTPRGSGMIQTGAQVGRAKSAIEQLQLMLNPVTMPDGTAKRPVDIFPDLSGDGLLETAGRTVGGRINIPFTDSYTTGQAWLDNVMKNKQNPDAQLATTVNSARGGVVNIVKGFGDAANIADAEQERLLNAFVPTYGDSPGQGGSAEGKVLSGIKQLQLIIARLESGEIRTSADLRAVLSEVVGSPLAAKPGAMEAETGSGTSDTPAGAPKGSAYDPAQQAEDEKLFQ